LRVFLEKTGVLLTLAVWAVVLGRVALCQTEAKQEEPKKEAPLLANESKGMPPRASPSDYQVQAHAGSVTIAADFAGHSVTTMDSVYESEDYVVVEVAFFGPPDSRLKLSIEDFSLKLKDRKIPLPSQAFGYLTRSLKDPEWQPPEQEEEKKSKTGINTGGGGSGEKPPPPKMPLPLRRAMEQKVFRSVLPEGDRTLPVAGLIFFQYHGKAQSLKDKDMQLLYSGPAGTASLPLQP
jgi:hypothetical protein